MRVLVLNSGSSSLKFRLCEVSEGDADGHTETVHTVVGGTVRGIGGAAILHSSAADAAGAKSERQVQDHTQAVQWVFEYLRSQQTAPHGSLATAWVDAVGHRVVHGGERLQQAVRIDPEVMAEIDRASELAPLHNPACLAGIRAARTLLGPDVPMVATFDTAFHRTLPTAAATYAIPQDLA